MEQSQRIGSRVLKTRGRTGRNGEGGEGFALQATNWARGNELGSRQVERPLHFSKNRTSPPTRNRGLPRLQKKSAYFLTNAPPPKRRFATVLESETETTVKNRKKGKNWVMFQSNAASNDASFSPSAKPNLSFSHTM